MLYGSRDSYDLDSEIKLKILVKLSLRVHSVYFANDVTLHKNREQKNTKITPK